MRQQSSGLVSQLRRVKVSTAPEHQTIVLLIHTMAGQRQRSPGRPPCWVCSRTPAVQARRALRAGQARDLPCACLGQTSGLAAAASHCRYSAACACNAAGSPLGTRPCLFIEVTDVLRVHVGGDGHRKVVELPSKLQCAIRVQKTAKKGTHKKVVRRRVGLWLEGNVGWADLGGSTGRGACRGCGQHSNKHLLCALRGRQTLGSAPHR